MILASSLLFSPSGRFDCLAIVARFYHPRPDTVVMVVARSRVHYWMPYLKPRRHIQFVHRKIREKKYNTTFCALLTVKVTAPRFGNGIPNLLLNASQEIRFPRVSDSATHAIPIGRTTNLSKVHSTSAVRVGH
jgi:hypothetical protein